MLRRHLRLAGRGGDGSRRVPPPSGDGRAGGPRPRLCARSGHAVPSQVSCRGPRVTPVPVAQLDSGVRGEDGDSSSLCTSCARVRPTRGAAAGSEARQAGRGCRDGMWRSRGCWAQRPGLRRQVHRCGGRLHKMLHSHSHSVPPSADARCLLVCVRVVDQGTLAGAHAAPHLLDVPAWACCARSSTVASPPAHTPVHVSAESRPAGGGALMTWAKVRLPQILSA